MYVKLSIEKYIKNSNLFAMSDTAAVLLPAGWISNLYANSGETERGGLLKGLRLQRKLNSDLGSFFAVGINRNIALMLFYDGTADTQTQACTSFPGRKERFEDPCEVSFGDSRTVIHHVDFNPIF